MGFAKRIKDEEKKRKTKINPALGGSEYKKRGVYKPKNELDGFLRAVFKGKYKWRRYKLFRKFLTDFYKDGGKVESIIETYQKHGITITSGHAMKDSIEYWLKKKRKERSENALDARWGKKREEKLKKSVDKGLKQKKYMKTAI